MSIVKVGEFHKLTVSGGPAGATLEIKLDDKKIERCTALKIESNGGGIVRATIEIYAKLDVDVSLAAVTTLKRPEPEPEPSE